MFEIITDTSANLDSALLHADRIGLIPFSFSFKGKEKTCLNTASFRSGAYYDAMRRGVRVTTSQIPPQRYADAMRPLLEAGRDVLYVGMSSGISSSFFSAQMAASQLRPLFPERRISLVDTLGASLGEGLLVLEAVRCRDEGMSVTAAAARLDEMRLLMCQVFTVDDLNHLKRGGRINAATALFGTMLAIKPVMHVDDEGRLIPVSKARGRKASLTALVDRMEATAIDPAGQTVFISHGDCLEDAEFVAGEVRRRLGVETVHINYVGPVIGNHSGPGTMALFFLGSER